MRKITLAIFFASLLLIGLPLRAEAQINNLSPIEQANLNLAIQNFQNLIRDLQNQHGFSRALLDHYNAILTNLQNLNNAHRIKSVPGLQSGRVNYTENGVLESNPTAAYCPPGGYTKIGGIRCPDDTIVVDSSYLDPNNGVALNESNPIDWGKKWNLTSILIHEKQHEIYVKDELDHLHSQAWWPSVPDKDQRNTRAITAGLSENNHKQVYQIQKQSLKDLIKILDNQIKNSHSASEKRDLGIKKNETKKFLDLLKRTERNHFGGGGMAKFETCGWPNDFHNGYVALIMTSPSIWERLDMKVQNNMIIDQTITQTQWNGEYDLFSQVTNTPSLFITTSEQTLFDLSALDESCGYYKQLVQDGDIKYSTSLPSEFVVIPQWIKNNAKWWSDGTISDKEFVTAIGYLVQQKIISTSVATNTDGTILVNDNLSIPKWIKNNAKWWSDGTIADTEFTSGIEYMINQNIISFSEHAKKQGATSKDTAKSPIAKGKQNETESVLDQIEEPTLKQMFGGTESPVHTASNQTTGNTIKIQSKHGSYEQSSDGVYNLYPLWVLESNETDNKRAIIHVSGPGAVYTYPSDTIDEGAIRGGIPVSQPGTYVFEIVSINGHPPPTDNRIEIIIPSPTGSSETVSAGQTTPTTPSTGTPIMQYTLDFSIPSQVTQEATSSSGATVQFDTQFSSPGESGNVIVTCNPQSGSQFPIGNTVVTCTATDMQSQKTLQKSFTVTVRDTTPPAINPFQPETGAVDDSGAIVYFTISATDLVDGPITPVCNHKSGDKFPIGMSTITCTADDSRGNHASRTLQITITKS